MSEQPARYDTNPASTTGADDAGGKPRRQRSIASAVASLCAALFAFAAAIGSFMQAGGGLSSQSLLTLRLALAALGCGLISIFLQKTTGQNAALRAVVSLVTFAFFAGIGGFIVLPGIL